MGWVGRRQAAGRVGAALVMLARSHFQGHSKPGGIPWPGRRREALQARVDNDRQIAAKCANATVGLQTRLPRAPSLKRQSPNLQRLLPSLKMQPCGLNKARPSTTHWPGRHRGGCCTTTHPKNALEKITNSTKVEGLTGQVGVAAALEPDVGGALGLPRGLVARQQDLDDLRKCEK